MTSSLPRPFWILALLAPVFALLTAVAAPAADACGPEVETVRVGNHILCTHGNDEPPPGVDITERPSTEELLEARFGVDTRAEVAAQVAPETAEAGEPEPTVAAANAVACIGDGVSGGRVQLVYARAGNVTSRYNAVLPLIRQYASDADDIVNVSAGRVGDGRRIRYVTTSDCLPQVLNVTLSNTGDDSFGNMVSELRAKGLTSNDRKYLVFADASVYCGLGEVYIDDRADQSNLNNSGRPMYARVDAACWQHAAAHELLHTLGAVQSSAPHATKAGHCTDEIDVMCYKDTAETVTKQVCSRAGQVDCNYDDYFHPNPRASSYLATRWNVARSRFLESGAAPALPSTTTISVPRSGYPGAPVAVAANTATANPSVVWSSTRGDCRFANPRAARTTWTCPATAGAGEAQITVNVTENGITSPYVAPISIAAPASKQSMSTSLGVSDSRITAGRKITLTSKFVAMATGAPVWGVPVMLQARSSGATSWRNVASRPTGPGGVAKFAVAPVRNTSYRVVSRANPTWASTSTTGRAVYVRMKLTTKVNRRTVAGLTTTAVREYSRARLAGKISPNKAGRVIQLKRYTNGRWRTIKQKRLNRYSAFVFHYRPTSGGTHRLMVVKRADRANAGSRRVIKLSVR